VGRNRHLAVQIAAGLAFDPQQERDRFGLKVLDRDEEFARRHPIP